MYKFALSRYTLLHQWEIVVSSERNITMRKKVLIALCLVVTLGASLSAEKGPTFEAGWVTGIDMFGACLLVVDSSLGEPLDGIASLPRIGLDLGLVVPVGANSLGIDLCSDIGLAILSGEEVTSFFQADLSLLPFFRLRIGHEASLDFLLGARAFMLADLSGEIPIQEFSFLDAGIRLNLSPRLAFMLDTDIVCFAAIGDKLEKPAYYLFRLLARFRLF
jgi:hypothetical protein